jgi:hypothetical protein
VKSWKLEPPQKLTEIAHHAPLIVIFFFCKHATPPCFDVADHNGFLLSA